VTITIELPDELATRLRADAEAQGRDVAAVVADTVAAAYDDEEAEMDDETIAALERGVADVEANRTFSLDEVRNRTDAALAARFGKSAA